LAWFWQQQFPDNSVSNDNRQISQGFRWLRSDHPNYAEATDTLDVTETEFFLAFASAVLFSQRFFSSRGDV
jgi:hypothetical protein